MTLPQSATLIEVGPRDGLQNEKTIVPTTIKLKFIEQLAQSGLTFIEATSFVSPKWVPQMADHTAVLTALNKNTATRYPVLVPNLSGLEQAMTCGAKDIAVFTSASETFSRKNTNCSITESLQRITAVTQKALTKNIAVRAYISCVLGCPYEGFVAPEKVATIAQQLLQLGCYEISLGDTIGVGTPLKIQKLIKMVNQFVPINQIAVHFHDTYGQALANIYAALQLGISVIDSSVAGLGGCPYAPGASGNVATEDVLYMLNGLNIQTGVDLNQLIKASDLVLDFLKKPTGSKVAQALS